MYKLEIKKAPNSDVSNEKFERDVEDLLSAIDTNLPGESEVSRNGNVISIQTTLTEKEIKDNMKPAFSHHFENIRFVPISKS